MTTIKVPETVDATLCLAPKDKTVPVHTWVRCSHPVNHEGKHSWER